MALHLAAKDPDSALRYTWIPPVADGDGIDSASITRTSGTVVIEDYQLDGDGVVLFVSGGADGETTIIAASVVTSYGETLVETLYLPVRADAPALGNTVRDVCTFALRKVVGNGADADAAELDDATERLSDMLAAWAGQGADLGVKLPCAADDVLYIPDAYVSALKNNLIVELADHYGAEIAPRVAMNARTGLQQIKAANLPAEREGPGYY